MTAPWTELGALANSLAGAVEALGNAAVLLEATDGKGEVSFGREGLREAATRLRDAAKAFNATRNRDEGEPPRHDDTRSGIKR